MDGTVELEQSVAYFRRQAALTAQDNDSLRAQLAAKERAGAHREGDDELKATLVKVIELDINLRFARDELRLERDVLTSVRHQVEAAEAAREASSTQLQRMLQAGAQRDPRAMGPQAAESWGQLVEQRSWPRTEQHTRTHSPRGLSQSLLRPR